MPSKSLVRNVRSSSSSINDNHGRRPARRVVSMRHVFAVLILFAAAILAISYAAMVYKSIMNDDDSFGFGMDREMRLHDQPTGRESEANEALGKLSAASLALDVATSSSAEYERNLTHAEVVTQELASSLFTAAASMSSMDNEDGAFKEVARRASELLRRVKTAVLDRWCSAQKEGDSTAKFQLPLTQHSAKVALAAADICFALEDESMHAEVLLSALRILDRMDAKNFVIEGGKHARQASIVEELVALQTRNGSLRTHYAAMLLLLGKVSEATEALDAASRVTSGVTDADPTVKLLRSYASIASTEEWSPNEEDVENLQEKVDAVLEAKGSHFVRLDGRKKQNPQKVATIPCGLVKKVAEALASKTTANTNTLHQKLQTIACA